MNHSDKVSPIESFRTDSIPKIVIKNSIPALIAMMMVMVYNLADTFFLGLTHNDLQVTAVSFATPLFMIFMSLGTLFGVGGTAKVIMIVTLIGIGIGSGVQPFLGYCYGAKEKEKLVKGIRFSALFGLIFCAVISLLCYIFAEPIVKIFLTDLTALDSGVHFTRILMSTAWLIGAFAICQNTLQAVGAATPALLASVFRQGVIFIPAVFIMKALMGVDGLIWAQPVADVLSLITVIIMLYIKIKKTDFTKPESD